MKTFHLTALSILFFAHQTTLWSQAGPSNVNPEVAKLNAVLSSAGSQKEKADACRELARIGTKESVGPLSNLLHDANLAHMARYALEQIPDPSVDEAFRQALTLLKGPQLVGVIGSVGVRRDAKATKLLAGLLQNPDTDVIQAAARALGNVGTSAAAKTLRDSLPSAAIANQPAYYEGLFRCAEALAAKGQRSQAVELYDSLRSNQRYPQVRAGALRGSILNRKDGLPLLIQVLQSGDYALFAAAVRTTLEMPGGEVTRALADGLPTLSPDRQVVVIQMLGKRGDPRAVPDLLKNCRTAPLPVRIAAIRALGEISDTSTTSELTGLLIDSNTEVAREALECLGAMQGSEVDMATLKLLENNEPRLRLAGMDLAVRRRLLQAKSALYQAAKGSDTQIRNVAVRKMADLAQPSDLPDFLDLLCSAPGRQELEATEQAVSVVTKKDGRPEACVEAITPYFAKATDEQRCSLLRILGTVGGPQALGIVINATKETNATVHAAAIRVLSSWNSAEAAPELLELARNGANPADKTICLRGYLELAGHGDLPVAQRLAMCREASGLVQRDEEKKQFLAALSALNSPTALELLQPYLDDETNRAEASAACVTIAGKILEGGPTANSTPAMLDALRKIADSAANPELATKAKHLLEVAQTKNQGK